MKRINILNYICGALVGLALIACEDMLGPDKDNEVGEERALHDPQTALGFLNAAYESIPYKYDFSECATDDAVSNDAFSNYIKMVSGAWGPLFDPLSKWGLYDKVMNINYFLTLVPRVTISWYDAEDDAAYRRRWYGEAYGLRGYLHFLLLKHYGGRGAKSGEMLGVPYFSQVIDVHSDEWKTIKRPPYQETVDSIARDLDRAIDRLPLEYTGEYDRILGRKNRNRFTKRIAYAVKAQLYLHAASPAYNKSGYHVAYCDSAAKYAALVLNEVGGLDGIGNFDNIKFYQNDNIPADVLWRLNQSNNGVSGSYEQRNYPPSIYGLGEVNPTHEFVSAFPAKNGYPITDRRSGYREDSPYQNRDPRLDEFVIRDGVWYNSKMINTAYADEKDGIDRPGATRTGYYLRKCLRPDFNLAVGTSYMTIRKPVIRYTEIYLIYAEAATIAYGADVASPYAGFTARDVIKAIRRRAGIEQPDAYASALPAADFLPLVRNERRLELSFEGFRFYDLRRWRMELNGMVTRAYIERNNGSPILQSITEEPREFSAFKYYAPLPNSELQKCPELEQNAEE